MNITEIKCILFIKKTHTETSPNPTPNPKSNLNPNIIIIVYEPEYICYHIYY